MGGSLQVQQNKADKYSRIKEKVRMQQTEHAAQLERKLFTEIMMDDLMDALQEETLHSG